MPRTYKKKQFSPHVYAEWWELFSDLPDDKKIKIFEAIIKYPAKTDVPDCGAWRFIKSQLDKDYQQFSDRCIANQQIAQEYRKKNGQKEPEQTPSWGTERYPTLSNANMGYPITNNDNDNDNDNDNNNSVSQSINSVQQSIVRADKKNTLSAKPTPPAGLPQTTKNEIIDRWNAVAHRWNRPAIKVLGEDQKIKLRTRVRENNITVDEFFDICERALSKDDGMRNGVMKPDGNFWHGADLDYFLRPANFRRARAIAENPQMAPPTRPSANDVKTMQVYQRFLDRHKNDPKN